MNLAPLIVDLMDRSEDLIPADTDRIVAHTLLLEELSLEYPDLDAHQRSQIVLSVLAQLIANDRFGWEFCGDISADDTAMVDAD
ncbi:MAG: hypothetical protein WCG63_12340 [Opitutaceae bacterium]